MARVLIGAQGVDSTDVPELASLVADGHDLVLLDPLSVNKEKTLIAACVGATGFIASHTQPFTRRVLEALPDLRVVSRTGVGYDSIDVDAATDCGVAVCTTPGTNQHSVADLALGLILACAREIPQGDAHVRAGQWSTASIGAELLDSTVGVVGTGLIGREVVKRLSGFGVKILAYDVVQTPELVERWGVRYVPLDTLLAESDFVTLHAPLTSNTRGLIGATALQRMRPTAWLINTARGPLVDEAALAAALRSGQIAGAALDVFEVEPLPADSPLRGLPNVIFSPHRGGSTFQSRSRMLEMAAENVALILRGEPPLFCVNPEVLRRS